MKHSAWTDCCACLAYNLTEERSIIKEASCEGTDLHLLPYLNGTLSMLLKYTAAQHSIV